MTCIKDAQCWTLCCVLVLISVFSNVGHCQEDLGGSGSGNGSALGPNDINTSTISTDLHSSSVILTMASSLATPAPVILISSQMVTVSSSFDNVTSTPVGSVVTNMVTTMDTSTVNRTTQMFTSSTVTETTSTSQITVTPSQTTMEVTSISSTDEVLLNSSDTATMVGSVTPTLLRTMAISQTPSPSTTSTLPPTTEPDSQTPVTSGVVTTVMPTMLESPSASTAVPGPTEPDSQLTMNLGIAVGLCIAVLLGLITILLVLICCYMFNGPKTKVRDVIHLAMVELGEENRKSFGVERDRIFSHLSAIKFPTFPDKELPSYVSSLHADSNKNGEEEYEDVQDLDSTPSNHFSLATYNITKNRYTNILCRDETRVMLSSIHKAAGSDYINANFIEGYNSEKEFIATQGPLPNTTNDFWRMVWEQDTRIIVMVTNLVENGMVKSHDYWPTRSTLVYGTVCVTLQSAKLYPEFVVRTFDVTSIQKNKKTTQPQVADVRQVTQFHFTAWPDFGVPHDASSMLKFVRHVRSSVIPGHGPIVIHCSAGVGRTGTFITVDVMLQRMSVGDEIGVKEFVCRMRAQRAVMVQTSSQYLFIYDALLHAYIHGTTDVPADKLKDHVTSLENSLSENCLNTTRLDKEFKYIMSVQLPADHFYSVAMETENEEKNRNINNLPLDHNRVLLREPEDDDSSTDAGGGGGEGDGEYINASYINGYYNRVEFIATQHPLPTTRGDLWRMVVEKDVSAMVVIGALKDDYDCYWPVEGMHEYDGDVTVEITETKELKEVGITIRSFIVTDKEKDSSIEVEQFHLHSWPNEGIPSSSHSTLDLIQKSRQRWKETGFNPIVIHTASGVSCEVSGVYCALCILLRQLEVEESVDVVTVCQRLRRSRPALLTSKDYYKFIYQTLEASKD